MKSKHCPVLLRESLLLVVPGAAAFLTGAILCRIGAGGLTDSGYARARGAAESVASMTLPAREPISITEALLTENRYRTALMHGLLPVEEASVGAGAGPAERPFVWLRAAAGDRSVAVVHPDWFGILHDRPVAAENALREQPSEGRETSEVREILRAAASSVATYRSNASTDDQSGDLFRVPETEGERIALLQDPGAALDVRWATLAAVDPGRAAESDEAASVVEAELAAGSSLREIDKRTEGLSPELRRAIMSRGIERVAEVSPVECSEYLAAIPRGTPWRKEGIADLLSAIGDDPEAYFLWQKEREAEP